MNKHRFVQSKAKAMELSPLIDTKRRQIQQHFTLLIYSSDRAWRSGNDDVDDTDDSDMDWFSDSDLDTDSDSDLALIAAMTASVVDSLTDADNDSNSRADPDIVLDPLL